MQYLLRSIKCVNFTLNENCARYSRTSTFHRCSFTPAGKLSQLSIPDDVLLLPLNAIVVTVQRTQFYWHWQSWECICVHMQNRQGTKLWHCLVLLQWLYITLFQPQPLNNSVTLLQQSLHPLTFSRKKENKFIIFSVTICNCTKMDNIDFHQITVTQLCMKGHTVLITFLNNLIWQRIKTTSVVENRVSS
jgi:hypothetical protein